MLFQRNVLPGTEPYLGGMPPFWPRHAGAKAVAGGEGPGNKEGMVQSFTFCILLPLRSHNPTGYYGEISR